MATKRVAICAVAQHKNDSDLWHKRFQGMLLDVLEELQAKTGFTFDEETGVNTIVSCSDDFFDARTISNNGVTDVLGAQYRGEEKMAQEGLNAVGYAQAVILSGFVPKDAPRIVAIPVMMAAGNSSMVGPLFVLPI